MRASSQLVPEPLTTAGLWACLDQPGLALPTAARARLERSDRAGPAAAWAPTRRSGPRRPAVLRFARKRACSKDRVPRGSTGSTCDERPPRGPSSPWRHAQNGGSTFAWNLDALSQGRQPNSNRASKWQSPMAHLCHARENPCSGFVAQERRNSKEFLVNFHPGTWRVQRTRVRHASCTRRAVQC
jgi:hypothetical protein